MAVESGSDDAPSPDDARAPKTELPARRAASDKAGADAEVERILVAAQLVLQRSGWWGFKVANVLRQADLSTRSFYRHFHNKDELLAALLHRQMAQAAERIHRAVTRANTPWDKVEAYLSAIIDMGYEQGLSEPSSLFANSWRQLLQDYPEVLAQAAARVVAPLVDALEEGQAAGAFPAVRPNEDAEAIFYLVSSMAADQAVARGTTPREEIEAIVYPFVKRTLFAPEPKASKKAAKA